MGQFLIVQASEHGATEAIFRNGLRAFERIAGLQPSGCLFSPRLAMASFPQLLGAGAGLTVEPESGRRVCQAGLCFYRGRAGTAALEELALDLENGVSTLDDLEGIFALASARPGSGELTVITDRLGSLHVYLAPLGPACLITTSALVAAAVCGAGWDRQGCREFLATGSVFETRSLFRGVSKLAPARIYRFGDGSVRSIRRYWSVEAAMFDRAAEAGSVATLAESLEDVMRTVAGNFHASLLALTGGLDSRTATPWRYRTGTIWIISSAA